MKNKYLTITSYLLFANGLVWSIAGLHSTYKGSYGYDQHLIAAVYLLAGVIAVVGVKDE